MRLRAFLELLEMHGGGYIRTCELAVALAEDGPEVRSALRAQGIVRDAPRADTYPCDEFGCAREVRECPPGWGPGLVAVCTRDPEACLAISVEEAELAQEDISRAAFVAAVQRALHIATRPSVIGRVWGGLEQLGEELVDGEPRDVVLMWNSRSPELRARLEERAASASGRRTRAFVLSSRRSDLAELRAQFGAGSRVTVDALEEHLIVRDGQIAELPRLALVPRPAPSAPVIATAPAAPPAPRSSALDGLREITRWNEITLFDVDDDALVGVTFGARLRRLSCVDFGLATVDGRRPLDVFVLLKTICRGNGLFVTRAFGSATNGKRLMSELRTAMRATFGLAGDPFERYSRNLKMWKPKFRALAAAPGDFEAAMRESAGKREDS